MRPPAGEARGPRRAGFCSTRSFRSPPWHPPAPSGPAPQSAPAPVQARARSNVHLRTSAGRACGRRARAEPLRRPLGQRHRGVVGCTRTYGCSDPSALSVTMRPSPFPRVEPSPSAAWPAPFCAVVRRFRAALGTPWRRPQPRQVPPRVHRCRRPRSRGRGGRGHRPPDRRPLPNCGCPPSRMSSCDSVWRAYAAARAAPSLSGPAIVGDGGLTSSDLTSGLSDGAGPSAPLVALSPERPYARSSDERTPRCPRPRVRDRCSPSARGCTSLLRASSGGTRSTKL
jgi:hypothetical protein